MIHQVKRPRKKGLLFLYKNFLTKIRKYVVCNVDVLVLKNPAPGHRAEGEYRYGKLTDSPGVCKGIQE